MEAAPAAALGPGEAPGAERPARSAPGRTGPAWDVPGLPARRAAAAAVAAVLRDGATLDDALRTGDLPAGTPRSPGRSRLRRFGASARSGARCRAGGARAPVRSGRARDLVTGAAQILVLDVPDHAAVDLSVRLASAGPRTRHLAGLVNALLRRVARERDAIEAASPPAADLPGWLARRWEAAYGPERAAAFATAHRAGAALDLTVKADGAAWAERSGAPFSRPGPSGCPAPPNADRSRPCPGTGRGPGGCRTPPPRSRPGCSRPGRASAFSTFARPRAARRRSSRPPAPG
jgi:hypothetical protein